MTSTNNIDGFGVRKYICIESVEIVIGTGVFSEISTGIEDFLGERSTAFENKLKNAKEIAFKKLRMHAAEKGGNAVIGIDIDYTEFTSNRIGLIANGTVVEMEKCETHFIDFAEGIRKLHELMTDGIIK
ncbi:Uncharacterized conserved protein YbjQ, UPF0145 family [Peptoclostridium litorale DSM 5388]|uniref:Uncharacterized protein n=1 Tax=Peptoclostridium litorale DSM 5388 TaxID=1121324 RepID=A0A069RKQ9_PEPLI|nr:heavy metal-binding domain-containing protein [Peptoclostridium litorale]KDR96715.1 hypothetical protein CLIT_2c03210 [Peptoclostridium litorale DSM 5388]SIN67481.1 Uncharacterized conserved protein YbjQ, UPF0145 family [Peptoclostridium litorale DSM 5388]